MPLALVALHDFDRHQETLVSSGVSIDFKEQVRSRTNIVDLIGDSIALTSRRGGQEFVGLCPFHDDHNPSLCVYPERQSFRCWVCSEGGDCFSWVMKYDQLAFREALELLAQRAGLELPRKHQAGGGSHRRKSNLYEVLAWAEDLFHHCLLHWRSAGRARDYLAERGFSEQTIRTFRLGYHPPDWQWLLNQAREKFSIEALQEARLAGQRRSGTGYYDFFVDRVLFPIRDERSRPVAFGGRILPDNANSDTPKYWNSPESPLFAKSNLLYGLDVARDALRKSGTAVVVEGYTDCITAHQYGLHNVVGTLGTALTESHVQRLKRFARQVVLIYDGDQAGRSAAERSLAKFLAQEVDLRILTLPAGWDPADFLAERGAAALQAAIDEAPEAWRYKLNAALERHGTATVDARQRVLDEMLELLAQAPGLSGHIREEMMLGNLAQRLRLDEASIRRRLAEMRSKAAGRSHSSQAAEESPPTGRHIALFERSWSKDERLECELLEILFADPETIEAIRQEVSPEDFTNTDLKDLLRLCYELSERGSPPSAERLLSALEDPEMKRLAMMVEDLSGKHDMAAKLREAPPAGSASSTGGSADRSSFLAQTLANFRWRCEERVHEARKARLGEVAGKADELNHDDKELLRRYQEFHQKRAAQRRFFEPGGSDDAPR